MKAATFNAQKQQAMIFMLLIITLYSTARMLSNTTTEHTLMYVVGTIACGIAFLNAEISIYFLIIAMLLSPEVDVGAKTVGGSLGRAVTLRLDDLVLLIICATWFMKSIIYKQTNLLKRTPLNGAMFLYALSALFSTLLGVMNGNVNPRTGFLFVLKYIEYFLVFWMVVNTITDEAQIRRFLAITLMVAMIVSFVAIAQIPGGTRVSAPFEGDNGEPNTLGGYLLLIIGLLMALVLINNPYRVHATIMLLVALVPFTYTLSRASYLGLAPMVLLLPYLTRRYLLLFATAILGLAVIIGAQDILPKVVYDRLAFTFTQSKTQAVQLQVLGKRVDSSTSARLMYIRLAIDAFFEQPIFGWGITGWHFIDSQYFRSLAETGLVGFTALAYLLFRIIDTSWQSVKVMRERDPFYYAISVGFLASTLGLMVHALGSNTFIIVRIMEPFWLLCAIVYLLPGLTPPVVPIVLQRSA